MKLFQQPQIQAFVEWIRADDEDDDDDSEGEDEDDDDDQ